MSKRKRSPDSENIPTLQVDKRKKFHNNSISNIPLCDTVMESNESGYNYKDDHHTESMDDQSQQNNADTCKPAAQEPTQENIDREEHEACVATEKKDKCTSEKRIDTSKDIHEKENCTDSIEESKPKLSNEMNSSSPNYTNPAIDVQLLFDTIKEMSQERENYRSENEALKNKLYAKRKQDNRSKTGGRDWTAPGEEKASEWEEFSQQEILHAKMNDNDNLKHILSVDEIIKDSMHIDTKMLLQFLINLVQENGRLQHCKGEFDSKMKLLSEINDLTINYKNLEKKKNEQSTDITKFLEERKSLLDKNREWEVGFERLKVENDHNVEKIRELQNEKGKLQEDIKKLTDSNNKLKVELKVGQETTGHQETQLWNLNKAKRDAENSSDQKDSKIERLEKEKFGLNNQVKHKDDEITKLKEQTQDLKVKIKKLEEDNKKELETNSTLGDKVQKLENDNADLKKDINVLKENLLEKDKELEKLKRKKPVNCGVPSALYNDHRLTDVLSQLQAQMTSDVGTLVMAPKEEEALKNEKFILIPCVNASRVGSDIEGTLAKIGSTGAAKLILLVFHHLAKHNSRIHTPTRDRIEPRQVALCAAVIDVVYWHHEMYPCDANTKAVNELKMALQMT